LEGVEESSEESNEAPEESADDSSPGRDGFIVDNPSPFDGPLSLFPPSPAASFKVQVTSSLWLHIISSRSYNVPAGHRNWKLVVRSTHL